jgi:hypothetical protein
MDAGRHVRCAVRPLPGRKGSSPWQTLEVHDLAHAFLGKASFTSFNLGPGDSVRWPKVYKRWSISGTPRETPGPRQAKHHYCLPQRVGDDAGGCTEVFQIELPISCAILAGRMTLEERSPRTGYGFPVFAFPRAGASAFTLWSGALRSATANTPQGYSTG